MTPQQQAALSTLQSQVAQLQTTMSYHKHTGTDFTKELSSTSGDGDMESSTYDPAGIAEQLLGTTATQTVTNKTISGSSNTITNISNASLSNDSLTIGETSIALGATASTISGVTLTSDLQTTTSSSVSTGTNTFDLSTGNVQNFTFSGSSTSDVVTFALSNVSVNQIFIVSVTQNSGGSGTVTWWSTVRWTGGAPPTLTTTSGKRDTLGFICTGSGTYDGFVVGQNI